MVKREALNHGNARVGFVWVVVEKVYFSLFRYLLLLPQVHALRKPDASFPQLLLFQVLPE